jgi:glycogen synthase
MKTLRTPVKKPSSVNIAFVTYETPYAPGGGISAVMKYLPDHVQKASRLQTVAITPHHHKIPQTASLEGSLQTLGEIQVPYDGVFVPVELLRLDQAVPMIFLRPRNDTFFAGTSHPYNVGADQAEISVNLLKDALFFGAATARALSFLDEEAAWIILLQDWEAATTILALAGSDLPVLYRAYLTLHNSYDMEAKREDLARIGVDPTIFPGQTILQRALPLVRNPIFTVSDQFAEDISQEILQSRVMAPHLALFLEDRLVGVDNGLFANLEIDSQILSQAQRGDFSGLIQWKAENRRKALHALTGFSPSEDKPVWGDLRPFANDDAPWFIMAGRDDPRQKGFDVACQAAADFLANGGEARFIFFPIPGDEGLAGLRFLRNLSELQPDKVLVLPFIFREGFFSVLRGSTFGLMPSFYEPFGMANEYYLNGTPAIGRATGGILQQIVPLRSSAAFSSAVKLRTARRYPDNTHPTGILFREKDDLPSALQDWQAINTTTSPHLDTKFDRLKERASIPLFQEMVRELRLSLFDGVQLYQEQRDLYFWMLVEGIGYLRNTFSWKRTASEYVRYMDIGENSS